MDRNGGMWRTRIRHCKAVQFALEDWKLRTFEQRTAIVNRAAWLTDRQVRALVEINEAKKQKP
jgi:acyl-CoA reductase-like NAD-dependent aldehyde dehydrogenase